MSIKELRHELKLTQKEVSEIIDMPLRTYVNYENDSTKKGTIKYRYIEEKLHEYGRVDESHGLVSLESIKTTCAKIFTRFNVNYAFLFGSYATGQAHETSDIDLLIATDISGMEFYGLVEELRQSLNKKIDAIPLDSLKNNSDLVNEIFKNGIKIYES